MKYTKRANGYYQTKIYLGVDDEGNKRFKYIYAPTIAELENKKLEMKNLVNKGINVLDINSTLSEWATRYLSVRSLSVKKPALQTETYRIRFFLDWIGGMKLRDVSQHHIQPLIMELFAKNPVTLEKSSKKTLLNYLNALSHVFEFAKENRATDFNPCDYVVVPKNAKRDKRRALSHEEIRRILDTPHKMQTAAILGLCGLRRGEATALLWSDIDLDEGTISVTKSLDYLENTIKSPKSEAGFRLVTMPDFALEHFRNLEKRSVYVVPAPNGKHMDSSSWYREWQKYLHALNEKYGSVISLSDDIELMTIEPFTMHDLRHTCSTLLYEAGVDILTHQKYLGHADAETTLNIYTHLDAITKKLDISKLNKLVFALDNASETASK